MKNFLINIFFVSQIFAIGGIGVYGLGDIISRTPEKTSSDDNSVIVTPGEILGAGGIGGFAYLDILPSDTILNIPFESNLISFMRYLFKYFKYKGLK